jgi:retron-type reverse transcriptase
VNSLRGGDIRSSHIKKCSIQYDEIITFENLLQAWNDFVKGKRGREDVNEFAGHLSDNLLSIFSDLQRGTYIHGAYEEYIICDPKKRIIHKASVRDRVVHRLIYNVLYGYFDRRYVDDSYSCRIGKGTHKAYARFRYFLNKVSKNYSKQCYVLKFDIKKCFDSVDTFVLKSIITKHIEDEKLLKLVYSVIDSFQRGLPLGNLTSQLFINVYLHELDRYAKHILHCKQYLRYADDVVIISCNKEFLEKIYSSTEFFLKNELHLVTHKKIICSIYSGIDVLGLVFFAKYERVRRSTERKRKNEIKDGVT